jgi:hypothetical protein
LESFWLSLEELQAIIKKDWGKLEQLNKATT